MKSLFEEMGGTYKYVNTTMGATAVATYLNEHGYVKKKRQNNTLDMFSAHFIKLVHTAPTGGSRGGAERQ